MKKKKIFVLDDEKVIVNLCKKLFTGEGYDFRGFTIAEDLFMELSETACDLLITDLKMPDYDGLEIIRRVKEIKPDCKIIMLTGFGTIESEIKAQQIGACDFIAKPFELTEIMEKVKKHLGNN